LAPSLMLCLFLAFVASQRETISSASRSNKRRRRPDQRPWSSLKLLKGVQPLASFTHLPHDWGIGMVRRLLRRVLPIEITVNREAHTRSS
jgi:hypothetical protein